MNLCHCADINYSDMSTTCLELAFSDLDIADRRHYINDVSVIGNMQMDFDTMAELRKDWCWYLRLFVLRERNSHLVDFRPDVQNYIELGDAPDQYQFWRGKLDVDAVREKHTRARRRRERGARPAPRRRRGMRAVEDARPGDGGDADSEGGDVDPEVAEARYGDDASDAETSEASDVRRDGHSDDESGGEFGDRYPVAESQSGFTTPRASDGDAEPRADGARPDSPRSTSSSNSPSRLKSPAAPPDSPVGAPGAASSGDAYAPMPAMPAPLVVRAEPAAKRPRREPSGVTRLPFENGVLVHYESNNNFSAECHTCGGRCSLTRSAVASKKPGSGRPIGFLVAWLLRPELHIASRSRGAWERPTFDERFLSRHIVLQSDEGVRPCSKEASGDEGAEPPVVL